MARRFVTPWSHFTAQANGTFLGFDVEDCETCGVKVQAANAVNLHESRERLLSLGMVELPHALPEQWYDEPSGQCKCDACPR